jgi:hypothetical protein
MIIIIKPFTAAFVLISALLIGCAAPGIRFAKQNANQVKTGMSVSQASAILGVAPNNTGNDFAEWRSNERDSYDGTPRGSVRFQVKDGLIVGVPDAGIISPEAAGIYFAELNGAQYKAEAERAAVLAEEKQRVQDQRRRDAEAAASAQAAAAAAKAKELREQRMRELEAERTSAYICTDKTSCGKAFALAQIFVSNNSNQKIQVATDTIIETYNPTEGGNIGLKIIKAPGRGTSEVISVWPNCKTDEYSALLCSIKRMAIYQEFRPFIETALRR